MIGALDGEPSLRPFGVWAKALTARQGLFQSFNVISKILLLISFIPEVTELPF